jgi:hypothetical protein
MNDADVAMTGTMAKGVAVRDVAERGSLREIWAFRFGLVYFL